MNRDTDPKSPLVEIQNSKTGQAVQNGITNTAGQIGRDALNGAGQVANTAIDAVTSGDMDNPFLFYAGAAGKIGSAAAGAAVTTTAGAAENMAKTAVNTGLGLLGDLTPTVPAGGSGRQTGGRGGPQ